jgi:hypothetical protein
MWQMRSGYKIGVGEPTRKRSLGRSRRTKEVIIQAILILGSECGLSSSGSGKGTVAGSCKHSIDNEPKISFLPSTYKPLNLFIFRLVIS